MTSAGLCLTLLLGACGGGQPASEPPADTASPASPTGTSASAASPTVVGSAAARVDLAEPTFSDPTSITNPWFSRDTETQTIQLGAEAGERLRFEVTQLPETKMIEWNGSQVQTRVTQFVGYGDGRLLEVAVDFYAQADDGSVWYFGENVDNYEDGVIADHEGTWLAGRDGPPGMIMPAEPTVGDVYRPENIPGVVFEEVTVQSTDQSVSGPRGPVAGAVLVQERLLDGTIEDKTFAPGYGEFQAAVVSLDELYHIALAVPVDSLGGSLPDELTTLSAGAADVFKVGPSGAWDGASKAVGSMTAAWERYRQGRVPRLLVGQMDASLDALVAAVAAREPDDTRQAAIDVGTAGLDLQLQFRTPADVDLVRLDVWSRQVLTDVAGDDPEAVLGDASVLGAIRDRAAHALGDADRKRIDAALRDLQTAADAGELEAAADVARTLRSTLAGL